jgi:hypothetical protein
VALLQCLVSRQAALESLRRYSEAARTEWERLRGALQRRIVGHELLIDQLAVTLLAWNRGYGSHRLLLTGRSGGGKTHIARCLAEVAGAAYYRFDVQQLSESGFKGLTIESLLRAMWEAAGRRSEAMESMVLVLDELDKRRIPASDNGTVGEKRRADQATLLSLLDPDGTPLAFNAHGEDGDMQVSTKRMLIIAAGAFSDASWHARAPTRAELVGYGFLDELISRITDVIHVDTSPEYLPQLLMDGTDGVDKVERALCDEMGFELEVDPAVYHYLSRQLTTAGSPAPMRLGRSIVAAAIRSILARALAARLEIGTTLRLTPDDLTLPPAQLKGPPTQPPSDDGYPAPY